MKHAATAISLIALAALVIAPTLVVLEALALDTAKHVMLAGTIGWFVSAPFWLGQKAT